MLTINGQKTLLVYDFNSNRSLVEDNWHSSRGNDFLNGFKTKTDGCLQHTTIKPSKFNATVVKGPFSGDDFLDGFAASTKTKRDEFLQQTTKSSKSNDFSGCRKFIDEQRKLKKIRSTAGQSPSPEYTRKPPIASTQINRGDEFLQRTAKSSSKSNDSSGCRKFPDEQRCLRRNSRSTEQSLSQCTRKPITASIKTPSPSTCDPCIRTSTTTIRSTSFECLKISEGEWQEIEEKSQQEQKTFLGKYLKEGKFKDVPVSSSKMNVRRGDHLFCQGALRRFYDHHFLCTDVDRDNRIHVIQYTGPSIGFAASSRSAAESNPLAFAAIKHGTLTYEELENKKAKIREWPEKLQRFPVDEVISRAELDFKNQKRDYHAFDNNCEHFVNWCKCGLNTSLQVKPWYKLVWDNTKAFGGAAFQSLQLYVISKGVPAFLKAVGELSDEILGGISSSLPFVGYAFIGLIETGIAAWKITKDYKTMKKGRISKCQLNINSVATASKAVGHITFVIAGSVIGSLVAGPLGGIAGGAIGYLVGHFVGSAVGLCYEYAPEIKTAFQEVIAPVKNVVKTCVNAVKTAGRKVCKGKKKVFSSLFSLRLKNNKYSRLSHEGVTRG